MPKKIRDYHGRTALAKACDEGNEEKVEVLLGSNPEELDMADNANNSPLQFACNKGFTSIVKMLLDAGANMYTFNRDGDSPYKDAEDGEHDDVLELLLKAGYDPSKAKSNFEKQYPKNRGHFLSFTNKALLGYVQDGDLQAVGEVASNGVKINNAHICAAAEKGYAEILNVLIGLGGISNPNPRKVKETPIQVALRDGNPEVVTLLREQHDFDPLGTVNDQPYYKLAGQREGRGWYEERQALRDAYVARMQHLGRQAEPDEMPKRVQPPKDEMKASELEDVEMKDVPATTHHVEEAEESQEEGEIQEEDGPASKQAPDKSRPPVETKTQPSPKAASSQTSSPVNAQPPPIVNGKIRDERKRSWSDKSNASRPASRPSSQAGPASRSSRPGSQSGTTVSKEDGAYQQLEPVDVASTTAQAAGEPGATLAAPSQLPEERPVPPPAQEEAASLKKAAAQPTETPPVLLPEKPPASLVEESTAQQSAPPSNPSIAPKDPASPSEELPKKSPKESPEESPKEQQSVAPEEAAVMSERPSMVVDKEPAPPEQRSPPPAKRMLPEEHSTAPKSPPGMGPLDGASADDAKSDAMDMEAPVPSNASNGACSPVMTNGHPLDGVDGKEAVQATTPAQPVDPDPELPRALAAFLTKGQELPYRRASNGGLTLRDFCQVGTSYFGELFPDCDASEADELYILGLQASLLLRHHSLTEILHLDASPPRRRAVTAEQRELLLRQPVFRAMISQTQRLKFASKEEIKTSGADFKEGEHGMFQWNCRAVEAEASDRFRALPDPHCFWISLHDFLRLTTPARAPHLVGQHIEAREGLRVLARDASQRKPEIHGKMFLGGAEVAWPKAMVP